MSRLSAQEVTDHNAGYTLSRTTEAGNTHQLHVDLSGTVKQFLRDVVDTSIKVDMLCYFARLATTGYYKSDSEWKTLSPAAVDTENSASLAVLPTHGYPAASFPSTQELAAALFHSEQSVHRAACELHSTGGADVLRFVRRHRHLLHGCQAPFSANLRRTHSFVASVV
jgi:hypothetical protein